MNENDIGTLIVACAVKLPQDHGPGLLETVFGVTLAHKLQARGLFYGMTGGRGYFL